MQRIIKRLTAIILTFIMIIGTTTDFKVFANNNIFGGKCGNNVTWELNTDTGVLTISGSGKMDDYLVAGESEAKPSPWVDYVNLIKTVNIEEGVTNVGEYAFWHYLITDVHIPNSVTIIGKYAFFSCDDLLDVKIPGGVTNIGEAAFATGTGKMSICLPRTIEYIGDCAFFGCGSATVYYEGSENEWLSIKDEGGNNVKNIVYNYQCDKTGHQYITITTPATVTEEGSNIIKCSKCGFIKEHKSIPKIVSGTLSDISHVYDEKEKNTNVSAEKVSLTKAKISKIRAKKKGFQIVCKKLSDQSTGYELQYSTSKKFKGKKVKRFKGAKYTVKKLKTKKKYYIRIRTYKTVKGVNYYSNWSNVKKVITKK